MVVTIAKPVVVAPTTPVVTAAEIQKRQVEEAKALCHPYSRKFVRWTKKRNLSFPLNENLKDIMFNVFKDFSEEQ